MAKDWSSLQEEIQQLYHVENKPLNEVMRVIKGRHGFHACERSYRNQLRKWGYAKYSTESCPRPPGRRQRVRAVANTPGMQAPCVYDAALQQELGPEEATTKALRHAILSGNSLRFLAMLHHGVPVNTPDDQGKFPLHYAVEQRQVRMVENLIRFGANVNAADRGQRSVLHLLVESEDMSRIELTRMIVDTLIDEGVDPSAQDINGNTPVHLAVVISASHGLIPDARAFFNILLKGKPDIDLRNSLGISPLELLVRVRVDETSCYYIDKLLEAGADISRPVSSGATLFSQFLVNSTDENGVLSIAQDAACHFLRRGADPQTELPWGEPIIRNILSPDTDFSIGQITNALGAIGELDTSAVWDDGNGIAHDACTLLSSGILSSLDSQLLTEAMLGMRIDPNSRNRKGETPFLLLTRGRPKEVSRLVAQFVEEGADPLALDDSGDCPLLQIARWRTKVPYLDAVFKTYLERAREEIRPSQSLYWGDLKLAAEATSWATARQIAFSPRNRLASDVDVKLRESALFGLAEKHVGLVSAAFTGARDPLIEREMIRRVLAGILRDCRSIGREIPTSWVDKLLEYS